MKTILYFYIPNILFIYYFNVCDICLNLNNKNNRLFVCSQNDRITKLKIDNNPFAKGFRACGQSKCKRKNTDSEPNTESSCGESSEAKRPCSDAASSCSEEGSLRSSSPRSPPLVESPALLVVPPENITPPPTAFYPSDIPYLGHLHMPMPLGIWPGTPMHSGFGWGPALPPPPANIPSPPVAEPAPCRRLKSFTISALLGEG